MREDPTVSARPALSQRMVKNIRNNSEGLHALSRPRSYIERLGRRHRDLAWRVGNDCARSQMFSGPELFSPTAEELEHEPTLRCTAAYRDAIVLREGVQSTPKVVCEAVDLNIRAKTTAKEALLFEVLDYRAKVRGRAAFDEMVLDRESRGIYRFSKTNSEIMPLGGRSPEQAVPADSGIVYEDEAEAGAEDDDDDYEEIRPLQERHAHRPRRF